jgi:hypothetical protein
VDGANRNLFIKKAREMFPGFFANPFTHYYLHIIIYTLLSNCYHAEVVEGCIKDVDRFAFRNDPVGEGGFSIGI